MITLVSLFRGVKVEVGMYNSLYAPREGEHICLRLSAGGGGPRGIPFPYETDVIFRVVGITHIGLNRVPIEDWMIPHKGSAEGDLEVLVVASDDAAKAFFARIRDVWGIHEEQEE